MRPDSPFIVAELGSNHDRSLDVAASLIKAAADAGVDAVKVQDFRADTLASRQYESLHAAFAAVELPIEWLPELKAIAEEHELQLFTTPFDEEAVARAADLQLPLIKFASGDLTNHRLLRRGAEVGVPIVISTGAATVDEVEESVRILEDSGAPDITILHCVSEYPTAMADFKLAGLAALQARFSYSVGVSDHTPGHVIPLGAVAMGATFIEKHLTLDRSSVGPDHPFALEPHEFEELVTSIRSLHLAMQGPVAKRPTHGEVSERYWARRGLYASERLEVGDVLSEEHLVALRPRAGIGAELERYILGRKLTRVVEEGDPIKWELL